MKGSDYVLQMPVGRTSGELVERDRIVLEAVRAGHHLFDWSEIHISDNGHDLLLEVINPVLMLGVAGDLFIPAVTARTQAAIAEELGSYFLTPHLCDVIWHHAHSRLEPCNNDSWRNGTMAHTSTLKEHSECVLRKIGHVSAAHGLGNPLVLFADPGKAWVVTRKVRANPGLACNYGWHVPEGHSPAKNKWAGRIIQSEGYAHNDRHVDYSQTVRLVRRTCWADGEERDLADLAADPEYFELICPDAPMKSLMPGGGTALVQGAEISTEPPEEPEAPSVIVLPEVLITPTEGFWDDPGNWRTLERGMGGPDVGGWQRQLIRDGHSLGPWGADDDFGGTTHNQTVAWQRARGLFADGVVGPATKSKIGTEPIPRPEPSVPDTLEGFPFVRATNYGSTFAPRRALEVPWIVVHTMEAAEASTTAESVAAWFASGSRAPMASAHFCIDDDSAVLCVPLNKMAWHAPGANRLGYGLEHAGYARQRADGWSDDFSQRMLRRSAKIAAKLAALSAIPLQPLLDPEQLVLGASAAKAGKQVPAELRGVTTHHTVSKAFKKSDHWDPGKHFPMGEYLALAQKELDALTSG